MGAFFRVFGFMGQVLGMVRQNPKLLTPVVLNIAIATPVNIVFAIVLAFMPEDLGQVLGYPFFLLGLTALYFIDYFCGGLTASMVYDQVTTGNAGLGPAMSRTFKASPGILIFAAVSAFFDFLSQLASQRRGFFALIAPILLMIIRSLWTTATYVIMPALVVEGQGFFPALKRAKGLMENDPTQVGVGIVGMGLVSWLLSIVTIVIGGMVLTV